MELDIFLFNFKLSNTLLWMYNLSQILIKLNEGYKSLKILELI